MNQSIWYTLYAFSIAGSLGHYTERGEKRKREEEKVYRTESVFIQS